MLARSQAGSLAGCVACFTDRGDGALVNASRSLTYVCHDEPESEETVTAAIRASTERIGEELAAALAEGAAAGTAA